MEIKIIMKKLENVFKMNNEYIEMIEEEKLKLRMPSVRSNTIGSQLACVARARDAYFKSIVNDEEFSWDPDFPYDDRYEHLKLKKHLMEKSTEIIKWIESCEKISENQLSLIIDLFSHEFLHQGQLIRYMYANNISMPNVIKSFWHLQD